MQPRVGNLLWPDLHLEEAVLLQELVLLGCLLCSLEFPLLHHEAGDGLRVCTPEVCTPQTLVVGSLRCCLPVGELVQTLHSQAVLRHLASCLHSVPFCQQYPSISQRRDPITVCSHESALTSMML